jgi:hypothetical protein
MHTFLFIICDRKFILIHLPQKGFQDFNNIRSRVSSNFVRVVAAALQRQSVRQRAKQGVLGI